MLSCICAFFGQALSIAGFWLALQCVWKRVWLLVLGDLNSCGRAFSSCILASLIGIGLKNSN
jgi:hypothetical protein